MSEQCPFCRGRGRVNTTMRSLPRDLMPLKVLAAKAGMSFGTIWLHKLDGLLDAQLWTGIYEKNGRRAVNTINVVTREEAKRYLAWIADRQKRRGSGGALNIKLDEIEKAVAGGANLYDVCREYGKNEKNVRSSLFRRMRLGTASVDLSGILIARKAA